MTLALLNKRLFSYLIFVDFVNPSEVSQLEWFGLFTFGPFLSGQISSQQRPIIKTNVYLRGPRSPSRSKVRADGKYSKAKKRQ